MENDNSKDDEPYYKVTYIQKPPLSESAKARLKDIMLDPGVNESATKFSHGILLAAVDETIDQLKVPAAVLVGSIVLAATCSKLRKKFKD
ncbi:hypothetical protein FRX31_011753 [Thalictrum thalictroides]|uniref:Uncharacterized protein n=1 Tax=Thalictrum thalictroides TaxID=46969 RepID=A0A7J6WPY8_THATH|nr:hypothetical protein FRX31_011753 [Thalictrum thalictroides]